MVSISSTSTLTKVTEGYLVLNSSKKGAIRWQGPHQVAVKSITTFAHAKKKKNQKIKNKSKRIQNLQSVKTKAAAAIPR